MRLEGTLDAFSLPDIFQLLSFTKKTGTLHLRREGCHGVVHLRDGAVTGARADVRRQELGRRLLGAGLVDDEALASAAEELAADPDQSLAQLLAARASSSGAPPRRWPPSRPPTPSSTCCAGPTASSPSSSTSPTRTTWVPPCRSRRSWPRGSAASRRGAPWSSPSLRPTSSSPSTRRRPATWRPSRDEWSLLSLVDGRRTVADLVHLSGRGEYAVVSALAGLVERGLLVVGQGRRPARPPAEPAGRARGPRRRGAAGTRRCSGRDARSGHPASRTAPGPVIPERPEPFTPARRPDHAEEAPAFARASVSTSSPRHGGRVRPRLGQRSHRHAARHGRRRRARTHIERDPSVNKSLLLRLIAGVRGL